MCTNAIAIFKSRNVRGSIIFHQCADADETLVIFDLSGLTPGKMRACHIHEYGDESDDCKSLGGHWNPMGKNHGHICISIPRRLRDCSFVDSHAGDLLNNIQVDRNGMFKFRYLDSRIKLRGDVTESIIGRSVVIHDGVDDLGMGGNPESLKTGNAGGRLACALIGHSK
jgi:Cu-Zn family superoxide dismutase